jgi:integrase/recombinase XerD
LAARAITPAGDWRWIGHGLTKVRASIRKLPLVKAAAVRTDQLFALGRRLFAEAAANADPPTFAQARMARDGLLIAVLALRPLRRKNIWSLTLGEHIVADAGGSHISIPAEQMKMQKLPYEADWPEQLTAELTLYLSKFRPVLVQRYNAASNKPPAGNALWVSERGTQLDDSGIYKQITKLTAKEFGRPINPHRFRHAAGGTVAVGAPEQVHLVSPVLGHHDPRSREFYMESDQIAAARRAHAFEDELIEQIESAPPR